MALASTNRFPTRDGLWVLTIAEVVHSSRLYSSTQECEMACRPAGSIQTKSWSGSDFMTDAWHYLVMKRSGSTTTAYLDGNSAFSTTSFTGTAATGSYLFFSKGYPRSLYSLDGKSDEFRVSYTARSAGWIKSEYNNQSSPATFYSIGSEDFGSSWAPAITNLSPTSGTIGTLVTITGANFNSPTVTFNGTTATPISWSMNSIEVPVPNASSGDVVVTVNGLASNGVNFTVLPKPACPPCPDAR
jgi:hypothetical protein